METITGNTFYFNLEVKFLEFIQRVLGETGVLIISQFSALGEITVMVLVFGLLYWGFDKKMGIRMGIGMMMALCLNPMVKNIAFRRRPYFDHPSIKCYRPVEKGADIYDIVAQGYSFPSGHSTHSVAVYGCIGLCRKEKVFKALGVVIPLLVGISRMAVGVHYPTDVLVGWLMGILIIFVAPVLMDKAGEEKRWLLFLIIFLLGLIGVFYCKTDDYFSGLGITGGFFFGVEIEERYVRFENSKKILEGCVRVALGIMLFLAITYVLKLPVSEEFLERGDLAAQLFRSFRYFVAGFIAMGLYPICFKKISKLFNR